MYRSAERVRCSNSPENVQHDFPEVHVGGGVWEKIMLLKKTYLAEIIS